MSHFLRRVCKRICLVIVTLFLLNVSTLHSYGASVNQRGRAGSNPASQEEIKSAVQGAVEEALPRGKVVLEHDAYAELRKMVHDGQVALYREKASKRRLATAVGGLKRFLTNLVRNGKEVSGGRVLITNEQFRKALGVCPGAPWC